MLSFGLLSDRWGRKAGMMAATLIVFVFACLSAGAYGAGGSVIGMLQALSAYR
jgi:MFS family permease